MPQRLLHALLERGLAHLPAALRRLARELDADPERAQPGDHFLDALLRAGGRLALCRGGAGEFVIAVDLFGRERRRRLARRFGGGRAATACLRALLLHEAAAERALGLVLIVPATAQAQVVERRFAAAGDRDDVVVLEPLHAAAAPALRTHERALLAVAHPDRPLHAARDVTRAFGGAR